MTAIALAVAATLFAWWFGTGAIFWLNGLALMICTCVSRGKSCVRKMAS